jgi:hypothetical protein
MIGFEFAGFEVAGLGKEPDEQGASDDAGFDVAIHCEAAEIGGDLVFVDWHLGDDATGYGVCRGLADEEIAEDFLGDGHGMLADDGVGDAAGFESLADHLLGLGDRLAGNVVDLLDGAVLDVAVAWGSGA